MDKWDGRTERRYMNQEFHKEIKDSLSDIKRETVHIPTMQLEILYIKQRLDSMHESKERVHKEIKEEIGKIDDQVNGKDGLRDSVTHLTNTEKQRTWHLRVIWTGLIASIGSIIVNLFTHKGGN